MERGFTILEMLVAMIIIGMIGLISYPLFSPATKCGQVSQCLFNVKSTATGALMYVADHSDHLPRATSWIDKTYPYVKVGDRYHCPALLRVGPSAFGYAFSADLSSKDLHVIEAPSAEAMIFESSVISRNAAADPTTLPQTTRHEDRNFVAYADGHAKGLPTPRQ